MSDLRKRFGEQLKELRLLRGLTQDILAEKAGLSSKYLGSVERGNRNISLDNMEKIANALGVDITELLRADDNTRSNKKFEVIDTLSKILEDKDVKYVHFLIRQLDLLENFDRKS